MKTIKNWRILLSFWHDRKLEILKHLKWMANSQFLRWKLNHLKCSNMGSAHANVTYEPLKSPLKHFVMENENLPFNLLFLTRFVHQNRKAKKAKKRHLNVDRLLSKVLYSFEWSILTISSLYRVSHTFVVIRLQFNDCFVFCSGN